MVIKHKTHGAPLVAFRYKKHPKVFFYLSNNKKTVRNKHLADNYIS